ncbi:maleylpyruvate isomerase family mycothiol-dependent enzyme [Streptomyces sp. TR06-5]|uniref:maleylpyruvate isomerase family mycothiol-dependent enzyme n=1 Tax=Streptomyces sp. TR06-5 TaxID=3385976 RepID=UPI0039A086E5
MTDGPTFAPAPRLDHDRYCDEIVEQTRLLRRTLGGTDLSARVPTCPDWSLRELAVHVGGAHRWVHEIVRTRATEEVAEDTAPGFHGPRGGTPDDLDAWLASGAEQLAEALQDAGAAAEVWTWVPQQSSGFWARRMTHETVVHRADASGAAADTTTYRVAADLAADCIEEWLDLLTLASADDPGMHDLRRHAGHSLLLHATDTPEGGSGDDAAWTISLGPAGIRWRRARSSATVTVRGPLTDVMRVLHRRLPPDAGPVEVLGDAGLLHFWLDRTRWA